MIKMFCHAVLILTLASAGAVHAAEPNGAHASLPGVNLW